MLTSTFALLDSYNIENVIKLRNGDVAEVGMLHQKKEESVVRFFSQWYDKDYLSTDQKNQQYVMIVNPKNK